MACEEDSWGLREYVASNVAVPEELRPQRVAAQLGRHHTCRAHDLARHRS